MNGNGIVVPLCLRRPVWGSINFFGIVLNSYLFMLCLLRFSCFRTFYGKWKYDSFASDDLLKLLKYLFGYVMPDFAINISRT